MSFVMATLFAILFKIMRMTPVRIYHDTKEDKFVATLMNPLIPYLYSKIELEQNSMTESDWNIWRSDKLTLYIISEYFRNASDYKKLIKE